MKKVVLICLLFIGATHVMAQDVSHKDSLLNALKEFRFPSQTFKSPNTFKLSSKDSLLSRMQFFKYPGVDSIKTLSISSRLKTNVTYSPVDRMPIAALPSNSRMPVYKLPRSNDRMPGSIVPQPVTPPAPQK